MPNPRSLSQNPEVARRTALGTAGVRLRVERFDARLKLSQNKSAEVVARIVQELEHGEQYRNPGLAREISLAIDPHAEPLGTASEDTAAPY